MSQRFLSQRLRKESAPPDKLPGAARLPPPVLRGPRLVARLADVADAAAIVRYLLDNQAHLAPTEPPRPPEYATVDHWQQAARQARREQAQGESLRLVLLLAAEPGRIVGTVNVTQIVRGSFQAAFLGYALDARLQGQGLMTEAIGLVAEHAFHAMRLHRLMANHLPENLASAAVLRKCGFEVEGFAKQYLYIAGAWRDHVLTARTHLAWPLH